MNFAIAQNPRLQIRVHGVDGSVATFTQDEPAFVKRILADCQNGHLFSRERITIAGQHAVTTFVASKIARIDLGYERFSDWKLPLGIEDIVELTEPEFLYQGYLLDLEHLDRRRQQLTMGDCDVGLVNIEMAGGRHVFLKIESVVGLPADHMQRIHSFLAAPSLSFRLEGGGLAFVNLANAMRFTVYPGPPEVPTDAWSAEQENGRDNENHTQRQPLARRA